MASNIYTDSSNESARKMSRSYYWKANLAGAIAVGFAPFSREQSENYLGVREICLELSKRYAEIAKEEASRTNEPRMSLSRFLFQGSLD